jgi:hypothetical protein
MEQEIELLEAPIDKISSEIDAHMEAIIELLPDNIKGRVAKSIHEAPEPPRKPKAPKPPKAPKAIKSMPVPPTPPLPPKAPNN